jgi:1,4-alpha-glucan branching enzyme
LGDNVSIKPFLTEEEIYLFHEGTFYHGYLKFGAHPLKVNEIEGVHFAVWAPHAQSVQLVGDFNNWHGEAHEMSKRGESGIWVLFVPQLAEGEIYKYKIRSAEGEIFYKADPWAFFAQCRPQTASIFYSLSGYVWNDQQWMQERSNRKEEQPLNIYEVHLGSWKRKDTGAFLNYRELAGEIIPYVQKMGFTHIELLPVMEHPWDGSWGYQVSGYFAATSRYGTPHDLMYFIDRCHQEGIGVILDWVPGHFCKDAHGLGRFDGTPLFEGDEHDQWGTYKFDFSCKEVWSFLISNAVFWCDRFHVDGLRVDGVTSMLFINYGKENNFWKTNINGGYEDLDVIGFLRKLNEVIHHYFPGVLMIAEESTDWPLVTKPACQGGLGFDYKWNMGWMNDTLNYIETIFHHRPDRHNLLTFSLLYAFSENFILPFSHDEMVHGKKSLVEKMPGNYDEKFAGLRLLLCYQMAHPGKKLLFMGGEIAQFIEWRYDQGLDWVLLDFEMHRKFQKYVQIINHLYLKKNALWEIDTGWEGFRWLDADNKKESMLIFLRQGKEAKSFILVVLNFQPKAYRDYRVGVPFSGNYREILNTDEESFGGAGQVNKRVLKSEELSCHGLKFSIKISIPLLAGIMIERIEERGREDESAFCRC